MVRASTQWFTCKNCMNDGCLLTRYDEGQILLNFDKLWKTTSQLPLVLVVFDYSIAGELLCQSASISVLV